MSLGNGVVGGRESRHIGRMGEMFCKRPRLEDELGLAWASKPHLASPAKLTKGSGKKAGREYAEEKKKEFGRRR